MKTNAPKRITWWISLILGIIGVVLHLLSIIPPAGFWLLVVAWVLLILATALKGL